MYDLLIIQVGFAVDIDRVDENSDRSTRLDRVGGSSGKGYQTAKGVERGTVIIS